MKEIEKGDKVYWNDPDNDECSGDYIVGEIEGEILILINKEGSLTGALITECTKLN